MYREGCFKNFNKNSINLLSLVLPRTLRLDKGTETGLMGKRQNADPRSVDYLRGPGPWTTLVDHSRGPLAWTTRVDHSRGPLAWTTRVDHSRGPLPWTTREILPTGQWTKHYSPEFKKPRFVGTTIIQSGIHFIIHFRYLFHIRRCTVNIF